MRRGLSAALVLAGSVVWSCAPSIDIPPAPDVRAFVAGFDDPTADVGAAIMADNDAEIAQLEADVSESTVLREFVELVQSIRDEIAANTDEDGNLVIDGTTYESPSGLVTINRVCMGHDEGSDTVDPGANGTIQLFMPLTDGSVGPEIWGSARSCLYQVAGENISFDGDITLYFGDLIDQVVDLRNETITFVIDGVLGIGDREVSLLQSFRLAPDERLEILLRIVGGGTFVYFFDAERIGQGIRDVTGTFECILEDRTCEKGSDGFSW